MSNLEKFNIELDRTPAVYEPGEHVTGKLHVISKETTKIKFIQVGLKGSASVKW